MKHLKFRSLEILSQKEKSARRVEFHPRITAIIGENDVGKSSLIKTIFWTFGASPIMHSAWMAANIKSKVDFSIDGRLYSIVRNGSRIGIFDEIGKLIKNTESITKELAPEFSKLINFDFVLPNRNGEPETPPPAYAFLPFYIDQDRGWSQPLVSFNNLQQYSNYRRSLIEFHSGIRPNEFYRLSAQKRSYSKARDKIFHEISVLNEALQKLDMEKEYLGLEFTETEYKSDLTEILLLLQKIRSDHILITSPLESSGQWGIR